MTDFIRLCFYNIANSKNDDLSATHRYAQREESILSTIYFIHPDVLALSELRICKNLAGNAKYMPEQIASNISFNTELHIAALRPNNLSEMCLWRSTMHSNKVKHIYSFCEYAINPVFGSERIDERGVMMIFSQFRDVTSRKDFWVINSHMPIETCLKLKTIRWLNENAEKLCKERQDFDYYSYEEFLELQSKSPIIFYGGNQNTFENIDVDEMMAEFSNSWTHLSENVYCTFESFPHNKFQGSGVLDHIFVNTSSVNTGQYEIIGQPFVYETDYFNGNNASNHLPLCVDIKFY
jgi:hypothetical protein